MDQRAAAQAVSAKADIQVRRIYENAQASDGTRVLVDRVWPRGVTKAAAQLDLWLREVAPSAALRRWFGHDPERFEAFRARYEEELASNHEAVAQLRALLSAGRLTLLYGARDEAHNQAVVLADYLRKRAG